MTLQDIKDYYIARAKEIQRISKDGTPWGFLCAAAFLDSLAKLVEGEDKKRRGYKDFVRNYLSLINPQYSTFRYNCELTDLPEQIYYILRCGIIHSYSLVPDQQAINNGGRKRSIVLCHRKASKKMNLPHLSNYSTTKIPDAALFVSEIFANDLKKATTLIFQEAKKRSNSQLQANIMKWVNDFPPICGGF